MQLQKVYKVVRKGDYKWVYAIFDMEQEAKFYAKCRSEFEGKDILEITTEEMGVDLYTYLFFPD